MVLDLVVSRDSSVVIDMSKSVSESYSSFVRHLSKYSPGVHDLKEGATSERLEKAEQVLGVHFPDDYREFLLRWNGGSLFHGDLILLGVQEDCHPESVCSPTLVSVNSSKCPTIPHSFLIIASYSYGDAICLSFDGLLLGKVYLWNHETGEFTECWDSLESWLEYEMELGGRLYNFDGSRKKTLFEKAISRIGNLFK